MTTYDTPTPVTLSIEIDAGRVTIDAQTTDTTQIELHPIRPDDEDALRFIQQARVERHGDAVTVHLPHGRGVFRRNPEIALSANLPVGSTVVARLRSADLRVTGEVENVTVESASGHTQLADISGNASLTAASGDIRLASIAGNLRVKTASGAVQADTCCADASVQTASGDITIGTVEGDADLRSASGDITVRSADGSARARTASGDVRLAQVRRGRIEVDSVSGAVEVGVERGLSVWLDVSSLSGRVDSRLEPTDSVGDGVKALRLHAKTVSGGITLTSA